MPVLFNDQGINNYIIPGLGGFLHNDTGGATVASGLFPLLPNLIIFTKYEFEKYFWYFLLSTVVPSSTNKLQIFLHYKDFIKTAAGFGLSKYIFILDFQGFQCLSSEWGCV